MVDPFWVNELALVFVVVGYGDDGSGLVLEKAAEVVAGVVVGNAVADD